MKNKGNAITEMQLGPSIVCTIYNNTFAVLSHCLESKQFQVNTNFCWMSCVFSPKFPESEGHVVIFWNIIKYIMDLSEERD